MTSVSEYDTLKLTTIEDCIEYLENILENWQDEYGRDYDACIEISFALEYVKNGFESLIETASGENKEYLTGICSSIDDADNAITSMMNYLDDNIIEEKFIDDMEDALSYISL